MIQKPKGTYDLFGKDAIKWQYIEDIIKNICKVYNYKYIKTPMFERSELFHRGMGETTDVVSKETYDFIDKGNRHMSLKPEGTAGVVRALIENKLYVDKINKFYYFSPCFRYDRPQAGRYREHTQFGVEVFGVLDPLLDAEVISIPILLYKMLGLDVTVKLNSLGDSVSREKYKEELVKYFEKDITSLCEDCQNRYKKNPFRILDCKVDKDNDIIKNAPCSIDYLNEESSSYFSELKKHLDELNIKYEIDHKLVRGLDYYTHTIFEFEAKELNMALGGGGRYDNLVSSLDGPSTPGIGFGLGLERLLLLLSDDIADDLDILIYGFENINKSKIIKLANELRSNGFSTDVDYTSNKINGVFKLADKYKVKYIILVGEELKDGKITVKNNLDQTQEVVDISEIVKYFDNKLS